MHQDEFEKKVIEAVKLVQSDPNGAALALLALAEPAVQLKRRELFLRTLGLVLRSMPPSKELLDFRVVVAASAVDEEPSKFLNVVDLAEAYMARGDFLEASDACDKADALSLTERQRGQLEAVRRRIEKRRSS